MKYLETPNDVLVLIQSERLKDYILLVRGGTTTFLAPAPSMGAIGILTMSGAPESHLGIISREFQTPCVMTIGLTKAIRETRREAPTTPISRRSCRRLEGKRARLDCGDDNVGRVYLEEDGASSTTSEAATYKLRYEPDDDGLRFQDLTYEGNFVGLEPVPDGIRRQDHAPAGRRVASGEGLSTTTFCSEQFTLDELNDLNNYLAWNIWDVLVMRATEGVSGMIPRQEYEILAFMNEFYRGRRSLRMITSQVGPRA